MFTGRITKEKIILGLKRFLLSCFIGIPLIYFVNWASNDNVYVLVLTIPLASCVVINPLMRKLIR